MTMTKSSAGVMTTFSVRCWSGQLDRIKQAAEREGKGAPEWILERLLPATGEVLGDVPPLFPEIKRRPYTPTHPAADSIVGRLATKLGIEPAELVAAVREATIRPPAPARQSERPSSISGTRKAVGTPRH